METVFFIIIYSIALNTTLGDIYNVIDAIYDKRQCRRPVLYCYVTCKSALTYTK